MPAGQKRAHAAKKEERSASDTRQPAARRRRVEEEAMRDEEIDRLPLPEGLYDSVLNAQWSHVLGFPEEEEDDEMEMKMEVKAGQAPQELWEYRQDGVTFLPVEDAEQFRPPRPRLMILTSEQKWPHALREGLDVRDCYVTAEVERVWRIVRGDLTGEFGTEDLKKKFKVRRRLLIGTPGTGKSMAAGSYLLHQLLRHDDKELQVVVYCLGAELAYVFDKTNKTVTEHADAGSIIDAIKDLAGKFKLNGYIIYDVDTHGPGPTEDFPSPKSWGVIVLSSPNEDNFKAWEEANQAARIIMNCPGESHVKAMCAWETRDTSEQEQADYCNMVGKRMDDVGPIPRCIFNESEYEGRLTAIEAALGLMSASRPENHIFIGRREVWPANDVSHTLAKAARLKGEDGNETFVNLPASFRLGHKIMGKLASIGRHHDILWELWRLSDSFPSEYLQKFAVYAFLGGGTLRAT
ncbi:retrotransposon hot spot (RHS) protein [Trypanosoma conorhini]|uniref:Retrotransposon hot spot (RHS) protein n=1 Tax=Trypanosoma conorhini TaxID=83891 RepID=A0A3R7JW14_9TRYP|nr:retrotransposon hot spot (RHS) protein [Trypanosoma conorhini]RNE96363.1 retrotransposon hot spot (RHS) protein [Trypanosoma conorhini]